MDFTENSARQGVDFPKMANKKPEARNSERYRKEKAHQEKIEHKKAKKSRDPKEPVQSRP